MLHVSALWSHTMSALDDLHRKWEADRAQAEEDGRESVERYGKVSAESCHRVIELMRPVLDEIPAQRREVEAAAIRQDRWFNGE